MNAVKTARWDKNEGKAADGNLNGLSHESRGANMVL